MKDVCGKRVVIGGHSTWCIEPDNHEGACRGVISSKPHAPPNYGPNRKDNK